MYIVQPPILVGDRPGNGVWRCLDCNWRVEIKDSKTPLPPCGGDCKDEGRDPDAARYKKLRGIVV